MNELLARQSGVLGLGEVGAFFSPDHMRKYLSRWGKEPDVRLCSCGQTWEECSFWREIVELSGEHSDYPVTDKYAALFDYIRDRFSGIRVVVDSTKNRYTLNMLENNRKRFGIKENDLQVLLAAKDVRSFTASIRRKTGDRSVLRAIRTMNWWHGENLSYLSAEKRARLAVRIVLYERLCENPERVIDGILEGYAPLNRHGGLDESRSYSHIVMGNKDFLVRNRERVRYDAAWFIDDQVNLAYLLHRNARCLNHRLYREAI
ncbi:MAG: hypothetical protein ABFS45_08195 [Pseudomonadota bacterium]